MNDHPCPPECRGKLELCRVGDCPPECVGRECNRVAEMCAARIAARLRLDETTIGTGSAELRSLTSLARKALREMDLKRLCETAAQLMEWLTADYVNRVRLINSIQMILYFIEAFGTDDAE